MDTKHNTKVAMSAMRTIVKGNPLGKFAPTIPKPPSTTMPSTPKPPPTTPKSPPPTMPSAPKPPPTAPKTTYTKKDAAADTQVKIKEVEKAWHKAREDAQKAGELPERAAQKARQKAQQDAQKAQQKIQQEGEKH